MLSTIQQLIDGRPQPTSVSLNDTVQRALELMIENDFSQLPVVDDKKRVVESKERKAYMVTSDSILRSLSHFRIPLHTENLLVSDALVLTNIFGTGEDPFDLFEALKDNQAVLVVDGEEHELVGIVTSFDATVFFRQRAEDIILVEWIESTIKDYITLSFKGSIGEAGQAELQAAIEAIMPSHHKLSSPFLQALSHYETAIGSNLQVKEEAAREAFAQYLYKEKAPSFDDLSLSHYIDLFISKSRWDSYKNVFKLQRDAIYRLLDDVRQTRNKLMHFRDEISLKERNQLRFCKDWLELHRKKVVEIFPLQNVDSNTQQPIAIVEVPLSSSLLSTTVSEFVNQLAISSTGNMESIPAEIQPLEEMSLSDDSRYAPLAHYLLNKPTNVEGELLTFKAIEEIIDGKLPASARKHRAWWSNYLESNPQARQWWNAGWRVSYVEMENETVLFTRNHERARKYNGFFSILHAELSQVAKFPLRKLSAHGRHWMTISQVPGPAVLGFSFARRGRFRVELYIDTGDKEKNKRIFDTLFIHKDEIQNELEDVPGSLEWERIDDKRASRIALYHEGAITDTDDDLGRLRTRAVDAMIKFQKVMDKYLSEVV